MKIFHSLQEVKILLKSYFTCWQLYLFPFVYFLLAFPFIRLMEFVIAYGWAKIYDYQLSELIDFEIMFGFTGNHIVDSIDLGESSNKIAISAFIMFNVVIFVLYPVKIILLLLLSYLIKGYVYLKCFFIYMLFPTIAIILGNVTVSFYQGFLSIFDLIDVQEWAKEHWVESMFFIFMLIFYGFCATLFRYIVLQWGVNKRFLKYSNERINGEVSR